MYISDGVDAIFAFQSGGPCWKFDLYSIFNRDWQKGFIEAVFVPASDQRSQLM